MESPRQLSDLENSRPAILKKGDNNSRTNHNQLSWDEENIRLHAEEVRLGLYATQKIDQADTPFLLLHSRDSSAVYEVKGQDKKAFCIDELQARLGLLKLKQEIAEMGRWSSKPQSRRMSPRNETAIDRENRRRREVGLILRQKNIHYPEISDSEASNDDIYDYKDKLITVGDGIDYISSNESDTYYNYSKTRPQLPAPIEGVLPEIKEPYIPPSIKRKGCLKSSSNLTSRATSRSCSVMGTPKSSDVTRNAVETDEVIVADKIELLSKNEDSTIDSSQVLLDTLTPVNSPNSCIDSIPHRRVSMTAEEALECSQNRSYSLASSAKIEKVLGSI